MPPSVASKSTGKRKANEANSNSSKKPRVQKKQSVPGTGSPEWPEYFGSLFKALNTVVAFCSSRKALATTFPAIRSSVENIIKRPLELAHVAEIKALLPDLVRFAYIPASDHRINAEGPSSRNGREPSPDIYALNDNAEDEEHVLVMEFAERPPSWQAKKNSAGFSTPVSLSPTALKNLIEKRNSRFAMAVDELILACRETKEDPVAMLQRAGADHIPVNPSAPKASTSASTALTAETGPSNVPSATARPSIVSIIGDLELQGSYRNQIVSRRVFDDREARWGTLDRALSQNIVEALHVARGVTGFYTHQAEAINGFWQGRHVIVSTSTASGKSIIYQVPILSALEEDHEATAIFIYPTKALAQDQKAALQQLLTRCTGLDHVRIETYDGDTPQDQRSIIRETASIIFTNFDMLHASVLPNEDRWRRFFKNMKLVVVDELHYYSGLMGSHVALVMRRFRRVCAAVGNRRVQFISCSATISNPARHMRNIFGVEDVQVVTDDGSPAGRKDFIIWQPPLLDEMAPELGRIRSITEACALFIFLMKRGIRTIVFCKIRRTCELLMKTVRADLLAEGRIDIASKVRAYRGGYSQEDRRKTEAEAFSGDLLGLVATNALELGVDIGSLDAVLSLGFPISIASFRQQSGRAGRRSRDSLSVLVSDSLPTDRHYVAHPEEIFDKPMEELVVDLENKVIVESHMQCAAHEMPINPDEDMQYFGPLMKELCVRLSCDKEGWYHAHPKYLPHPSKHVAIRGTREDKFTVIDVTTAGRPNGRSKILEEIEISRAIFETYEGGVFMHQGLTFVVKEVNHDERTAKIVRSDVNWVTRPRSVDAVETLRIREIRRSPQRAYFGRVGIVIGVFGFYKLRQDCLRPPFLHNLKACIVRHNVILETVDLETPPFEQDSSGMWVDIPRPVLELLFRKGRNPAEGIHSAQHAVLSLTPLYSMSAAGDVRTECKSPVKEYSSTDSKVKRPGRLIFYDAAGTGGGICAKAFDHITDLLEQALSTIEKCECREDDGCTSCIQSAMCRERNVVASKLGAKVILQSVLGRTINEDELGPDLDRPLSMDTVVPASTVHGMDSVVVELDPIG
ncbi:hypothetical protein BS47DRAFT_1298934 [Hydnum rufescens UP504]|uniref:DEAD/DEAH box helicase n=1 Tax=Hydnum rufescens UP504 TaxID=1448309 RepID=A0A9P6ASW4_9AGAM|nr:hypothetical protein BS47DRAFT_1298934 [Hydnum rufescens UP504]